MFFSGYFSHSYGNHRTKWVIFGHILVNFQNYFRELELRDSYPLVIIAVAGKSLIEFDHFPIYDVMMRCNEMPISWRFPSHVYFVEGRRGSQSRAAKLLAS